MKNTSGIIEQIKKTKTAAAASKLIKKLADYKNASPKTINRCIKLALARGVNRNDLLASFPSA